MEDRLVESYFNYNPEEDPSGDIGHAIAEMVSKRCGYDTSRISKWAVLKKLEFLEQEVRENEKKLLLN